MRHPLILPRRLSLFLNQSRSLPHPPVPDEQIEALERECRRLRAEKVEWANSATIVRLDRDRLVHDLLNAKRDADWLRSQNQRLWTVVACTESLFASRTWSRSSLSESDATPVARLRAAVGVVRRANGVQERTQPMQAAYRIEKPADA